MNKIVKFLEKSAGFLIGFGLAGLADGWYETICALIAAAGIVFLFHGRELHT